MSTHVDSVTLAKRSGDNAVELQVFHVQVTAIVLHLFERCSLLFIMLFGRGGGTGRHEYCTVRIVRNCRGRSVTLQHNTASTSPQMQNMPGMCAHVCFPDEPYVPLLCETDDAQKMLRGLLLRTLLQIRPVFAFFLDNRCCRSFAGKHGERQVFSRPPSTSMQAWDEPALEHGYPPHTPPL